LSFHSASLALSIGSILAPQNSAESVISRPSLGKKYSRPAHVLSAAVTQPRFGTAPRAREKSSFSAVRFSFKLLSVGAWGIGFRQRCWGHRIVRAKDCVEALSFPLAGKSRQGTKRGVCRDGDRVPLLRDPLRQGRSVGTESIRPN